MKLPSDENLAGWANELVKHCNGSVAKRISNAMLWRSLYLDGAFCTGLSGNMVAPTLILTGARDDWTPPRACQDLVKRAGDNGATIDLVVYPDAYHGFDMPALSTGRRYFGHWVEYNEAAATDALMQTQRFLDAHLLARAKR